MNTREKIAATIGALVLSFVAILIADLVFHAPGWAGWSLAWITYPIAKIDFKLDKLLEPVNVRVDKIVVRDEEAEG